MLIGQIKCLLCLRRALDEERVLCPPAGLAFRSQTWGVWSIQQWCLCLYPFPCAPWPAPAGVCLSHRLAPWPAGSSLLLKVNGGTIAFPNIWTWSGQGRTQLISGDRFNLVTIFFAIRLGLNDGDLVEAKCLKKIGSLIRVLLSEGATFSFTFRWVLIIYLLREVRFVSNLISLVSACQQKES